MTLDKARIARQIRAVGDRGSRGDLLPFSKRKDNSEAIELGDDDLVFVEDPTSHAISHPSSLRSPASLASRHPGTALVASSRDADLAATALRRPRKVTPAGSRRILAEAVEEDVAGECLASIAETRDLHSSSHIRTAVARPAPSTARTSFSPVASAAPSRPPTPPSARGPVQARLPSVSPPPFVRTTTTRRGAGDASGARDSAPPPAFVRRSSPSIPASSTAAVEPTARSVAPLSLSQGAVDSTVVVVRERPKAAWVISAAVIGALCAFGATRLLGSSASPEEHAAPSVASTLVATAVPASQPAPPPASLPVPLATVALPASAAALPATAPSVAVMRFGDDQGVAIKVSPRATTPAPAVAAAAPARPAAPRPHTSAVGPALPDGSFGLGRNDGAPATTSAAPATAALPAPAPPAPAPTETAKRRALTPEQQLAEAQLKASMR